MVAPLHYFSFCPQDQPQFATDGKLREINSYLLIIPIFSTTFHA